jgi:multidrug efflux pump subunit AcrA (membrane-fusion protein)
MKKLRKTIHRHYRAFLTFSESKPLVAFSVLLGLLVVLIALGNFLRQPKTVSQTVPPPQPVATYKIGSVPKVSFQAQVEKSGVIQITAQTGGIVSQINVSDGSKVARGTLLISLVNSYSGGNAMTYSRQLAQKQNDLTETLYPIQKSIIVNQREVVNQNQTNFEKLRDITNQSINDTQTSININGDIISTLTTNIQNLSVDPIGNATLILTSKQLLSQFQSANNQLNAALRGSSYQADTNNPPSKLSDLQKTLALQQLDIQEKSLDLGRDISALQLKLARVNESLMYPSAPFSGSVERVLVRVGQSVSPGTPLLVISGDKNLHLNAVVYLSKELADSVSRIDPAVFHIGGQSLSALPTYISKEATTGNLYSAVYALPEASYSGVTDKGYIVADLPIGYPDSNSVVPFVPLDAVYQTQDRAFVFVTVNGIARSKQISIGTVLGNFVQVNSGLAAGDVVIEDRTVVDGQSVVSK